VELLGTAVEAVQTAAEPFPEPLSTAILTLFSAETVEIAVVAAEVEQAVEAVEIEVEAVQVQLLRIKVRNLGTGDQTKAAEGSIVIEPAKMFTVRSERDEQMLFPRIADGVTRRLLPVLSLVCPVLSLVSCQFCPWSCVGQFCPWSCQFCPWPCQFCPWLPVLSLVHQFYPW
jgi:hypothetical protein